VHAKMPTPYAGAPRTAMLRTLCLAEANPVSTMSSGVTSGGFAYMSMRFPRDWIKYGARLMLPMTLTIVFLLHELSYHGEN
jgi:hypothetical protein